MRTEMLKLHGIKVPAEDYGALRAISGVLYLQTDVNEPESESQKRAVLAALDCLAQFRNYKHPKS